MSSLEELIPTYQEIRHPYKKRGGSSDYPREKPKNPKGRSIEPPCLATTGKNHRNTPRSTDFRKKKLDFSKIRGNIGIPFIEKGFFIAR
jgi:hypothetical protein